MEPLKMMDRLTTKSYSKTKKYDQDQEGDSNIRRILSWKSKLLFKIQPCVCIQAENIQMKNVPRVFVYLN